MSASSRRLGRLIGIILIFSVVGPLAFAALTSLIVVAFGAALLQLLLAFVDLSALRPTFSIAVGLLAFLAVMASIPPSAVTGLIFASSAVYVGIGAIWMAWLAAAVAIAGVVSGGMFFYSLRIIRGDPAQRRLGKSGAAIVRDAGSRCRLSPPACAGGSRSRCIVLLYQHEHALPHRHPGAPHR